MATLLCARSKWFDNKRQSAKKFPHKDLSHTLVSQGTRSSRGNPRGSRPARKRGKHGGRSQKIGGQKVGSGGDQGGSSSAFTAVDSPDGGGNPWSDSSSSGALGGAQGGDHSETATNVDGRIELPACHLRGEDFAPMIRDESDGRAPTATATVEVEVEQVEEQQPGGGMYSDEWIFQAGDLVQCPNCDRYKEMTETIKVGATPVASHCLCSSVPQVLTALAALCAIGHRSDVPLQQLRLIDPADPEPRHVLELLP